MRQQNTQISMQGNISLHRSEVHKKNYEITDAYIRWENLILVYVVQGGVPNVPFLNNS